MKLLPKELRVAGKKYMGQKGDDWAQSGLGHSGTGFAKYGPAESQFPSSSK